MKEGNQTSIEFFRSTSGLGTVTAVLVAAAAFLTPAQAQSQASPAPAEQGAAPSAQADAERGDIVVTATRRAQGAQSVPLALTAVGGDQLTKEGITSVGQLTQLAPSLYFIGQISAGSPRFSIRGISSNETISTSASAVATYIDDVYQASQYGISSALFDLQRIEVLRGPQGTAFGKNTTGGAVAYFSQTPTNETEGYVTGRLAGGDQAQRFLEAAVNVPIVDNTLAMRISLRADSHSDFMYDQEKGKNRGGSDGQAGRFQLRWTPSADTTVNLTIHGSRYRGDTPLYHTELLDRNTFQQVLPSSRDYVAMSPIDLYDDFDNWGATLRIEQSLGSFDLTAISHYRKTHYKTAQDVDGRPEDVFNYSSDTAAKQYGQEIRLASDATKRVSAILGLYYQKDTNRDDYNEFTVLNGPATDPFDFSYDYNDYAHYVTKTETVAAFLNATFKVTDSLSIIGGIRKSREKKTVDAIKYYFVEGNYDWTQGNIVLHGPPPVAPYQTLPYNLPLTSKPWTWDITVNYNPSRSLLLFGRVAKGFRSGGFNPAAAAFFPGPFVTKPNPFQGETVKSYELGVKSGLFDNMVRFNASIYHLDYQNQQVTVYPNGILTTINAATSKIDGAEVEISARPAEGLQFRASGSYNNGKYKTFINPFNVAENNSGNQLIQSPKWTFNASVDYSVPISANYELQPRAALSHRSTVYNLPDNDTILAAGPLTTIDFALGLQPTSGKGFSVRAFVNNITNRRPLASGFNFDDGAAYLRYLKFYDTGRLFGVDVRYQW